MNHRFVPRRLVPRRFIPTVVLVGTLAASAALAGSPLPVAGSCAELVSFEEAVRLPGAAVFTGHAVREDAEYRVVFPVDRWFVGSHPARVVLFGDALAGLVEEPQAGVIPAVLARTVSGEGVGFVRDEPVIVTAIRTSNGEYDPVICMEAVVPLASPEGQAVLARATALFGPGTPAAQLPAAQLPATATLPDVARTAGSSPPWLPAAAFLVGLAGMLLILRRRSCAAGHQEGMTRE